MRKHTTKILKDFCVATGRMMDPKKLTGVAPKDNKKYYRQLKKIYNDIPKNFRYQYLCTLSESIDVANTTEKKSGE